MLNKKSGICRKVGIMSQLMNERIFGYVSEEKTPRTQPKRHLELCTSEGCIDYRTDERKKRCNPRIRCLKLSK